MVASSEGFGGPWVLPVLCDGGGDHSNNGGGHHKQRNKIISDKRGGAFWHGVSGVGVDFKCGKFKQTPMFFFGVNTSVILIFFF